MGSCSNKPKIENSIHKIKIVPKNLISDFAMFYKQMKAYLSSIKFSFDDADAVLKFTGKLSNCYEISEDRAQIWVDCYVDYMIYLTYLNIRDSRTTKELNGVAPYAIIQTWRIHILYSINYKLFCSILSGGKIPLFSFIPNKFTSNTPINCQSLKSKYNAMRIQIGALIYSGRENQAVKTKNECINSGEIWEDFEQTFFKNELSYCFVSDVNTAKFYDMLNKNKDQMIVDSRSISNIAKIRDAVRKNLDLDSLALADRCPIPSIMMALSPMLLQNPSALTFAVTIDNILFTPTFVKILSLEQLINVEEAMLHILEYKKFLFMIFMYGSPVLMMSPSEIVDQVWHLHLQYTLDYDASVNKIKPTYHFPSKGKIFFILIIYQEYRRFSRIQQIFQFLY